MKIRRDNTAGLLFQLVKFVQIKHLDYFPMHYGSTRAATACQETEIIIHAPVKQICIIQKIG